MLPLVHHHDPVRDGHGLFLVVGHVHRRDGELLLQLLDLAAHVDAKLRVQVGERLVEEENPRADHDGAGERHALLLPPRELVGKLPVVAAEPHKMQDLAHGLADLCLGHPFHPEPVGHVLEHREMREEGVVLEDEADVPLIGHQVGDVLFADEDPPGVRALEAGDHSQRRGLAAAGRAQQA